MKARAVGIVLLILAAGCKKEPAPVAATRPSGGEADVPQLVQRLADADPIVRAGAACALGENAPGAKAALDALAGRVGVEQVRGVRCACVRAMGRMGNAAEPRLLELLQGEDDWIAAEAARALAGIGPSPDAVRALVARARRLDQYAVPFESFPGEHPRRPVRAPLDRAIALALSAGGKPALDQLPSLVSTKPDIAWEAWVRMGRAGAPGFFTALQQKTDQLPAAARIAADSPATAVELARAGVGGADLLGRGLAMALLIEMGPAAKPVREELLAILNAKPATSSSQSILTGIFGHSDGYRDPNSGEEDLRLVAAVALASMGEKSDAVVAPLRRAITAKEPVRKILALRGLGALGSAVEGDVPAALEAADSLSFRPEFTISIALMGPAGAEAIVPHALKDPELLDLLPRLAPKMDEPTFERFLKALEARGARGRSIAATCLYERCQGGPQYANAWTATLRGDKPVEFPQDEPVEPVNPRIHPWIQCQLMQLEPSALEPFKPALLNAAMRNSGPDTVLAALALLRAGVTTESVQRLLDTWPGSDEELCHVRDLRKPESVAILVSMLADATDPQKLTGPTEMRTQRIGLLLHRSAPLDASHLPALRKMLKPAEGNARWLSGSRDTRMLAIQLVGEMGPAAKPAIEDLIACLRDAADETTSRVGEVGIRQLAAEALGKIAPDATAVQVALFECIKDVPESRRYLTRPTEQFKQELVRRITSNGKHQAQAVDLIIEWLPPRAAADALVAAYIASSEGLSFHEGLDRLGSVSVDAVLDSVEKGKIDRDAFLLSLLEGRPARTERAQAVLTPLMFDSREVVRAQARDVLGSAGTIRDTAALDKLVEELKQEWLAASQARDVLEQTVQDPATRAALAKALRGRSRNQKSNALEALRPAGPATVDILDDIVSCLPEERVGEDAAWLLVRCGSKAAPAALKLVARLKAGGGDAYWAALVATGNASAEVMAELQQLADSARSDDTRALARSAITILRAQNPSTATAPVAPQEVEAIVKPLIANMNGTSLTLAWHAAAIGRPALPLLLKTLREDPRESARTLAAEAIAAMTPPPAEAAEMLAKVGEEDRDSMVRAHALRTLDIVMGKPPREVIANIEALPPLAAAVQRIEIAYPEDLSVLLDGLKDERSRVRALRLICTLDPKALGEVRGPLLELIDKVDRDVQLQILACLGRMGGLAAKDATAIGNVLDQCSEWDLKQILPAVLKLAAPLGPKLGGMDGAVARALKRSRDEDRLAALRVLAEQSAIPAGADVALVDLAFSSDASGSAEAVAMLRKIRPLSSEAVGRLCQAFFVGDAPDEWRAGRPRELALEILRDSQSDAAIASAMLRQSAEGKTASPEGLWLLARLRPAPGGALAMIDSLIASEEVGLDAAAAMGAMMPAFEHAGDYLRESLPDCLAAGLVERERELAAIVTGHEPVERLETLLLAIQALGPAIPEAAPVLQRLQLEVAAWKAVSQSPRIARLEDLLTRTLAAVSSPPGGTGR